MKAGRRERWKWEKEARLVSVLSVSAPSVSLSRRMMQCRILLPCVGALQFRNMTAQVMAAEKEAQVKRGICTGIDQIRYLYTKYIPDVNTHLLGLSKLTSLYLCTLL